jgi:hypothetical protein
MVLEIRQSVRKNIAEKAATADSAGLFAVFTYYNPTVGSCNI